MRGLDKTMAVSKASFGQEIPRLVAEVDALFFTLVLRSGSVSKALIGISGVIYLNVPSRLRMPPCVSDAF
jgi:hypothetical protein